MNINISLPKIQPGPKGGGINLPFNQSINVWTLKAKSLLPSLYPPGQLPARRALQLGERPLWVGDKRGEFPLFGIFFLSLDRQRGVSLPAPPSVGTRAGRQGEILEEYVWSIMESLVILERSQNLRFKAERDYFVNFFVYITASILFLGRYKLSRNPS
jgi:hypothetical protein